MAMEGVEEKGQGVMVVVVEEGKGKEVEGKGGVLCELCRTP